MFNQKYTPEDQEFRDVLKFSQLILEGLGNGDPVAFMPWLRFFPSKSLTMIKEGINIKDPYFRKKVIEHRETFDPAHIRDFTDSLIKVSKDENIWKDMKKQVVQDDELELLLIDMLIAGLFVCSL